MRILRVVMASSKSFLFGLLVLALGDSAQGQEVQEIRIHWRAYDAPGVEYVAPGSEPAANQFTLLGRRQFAGTLPRQRHPQLSADHIVVVAVDSQERMVVTIDDAGEPVFSYMLWDPRVVRAESADSKGQLSGEVFHLTETELVVALPGVSEISGIRLYKPRWTGTSFVLDLLGSVRFE